MVAAGEAHHRTGGAGELANGPSSVLRDEQDRRGRVGAGVLGWVARQGRSDVDDVGVARVDRCDERVLDAEAIEGGLAQGRAAVVAAKKQRGTRVVADRGRVPAGGAVDSTPLGPDTTNVVERARDRAR